MHPGTIKNFVRLKYRSWIVSTIILLILLSAAVALSLISGNLPVGLGDLPALLKATAGVQNGGGNLFDPVVITVFRQIRLPRMLLGLAVGGSLSLSGVILQGIYRNPLVEPYTLGISGGAALTVAAAMTLGLTHKGGIYTLPVAGFIGAVISVFAVYTLSIKNGKIRIEHMLLTGVMISFIVSSVMMFLMAITSTENLRGIIFWTMGSLDEPSFPLTVLAFSAAIVSLVISMFLAPHLNALRLGREKAKHLGIETEKIIRFLFILASLLTGICVSIAGVIGFVGLIVPHLMRMISGRDYRILLLHSFLAGGMFLILCDIAAKTVIAPNELPVGVITGMTGGSLFVIILSRTKKNIF